MVEQVKALPREIRSKRIQLSMVSRRKFPNSIDPVAGRRPSHVEQSIQRFINTRMKSRNRSGTGLHRPESVRGWGPVPRVRSFCAAAPEVTLLSIASDKGDGGAAGRGLAGKRWRWRRQKRRGRPEKRQKKRKRAANKTRCESHLLFSQSGPVCVRSDEARLAVRVRRTEAPRHLGCETGDVPSRNPTVSPSRPAGPVPAPVD